MTTEAARPEREVVVVFRKAAVERVNAYADYACSRGVDLTVVAADGQGWKNAPPFDPRVRVRSLARLENTGPGVWTYCMLVERAPQSLLRRLRSRLPGRAGRAAEKLRRLHRRIAGKLRRHVFWPVYRPLRPQSVRRRARRSLPGLGFEAATRVIVADEAAVPFGWMLTRRYPGLEVTRTLDRARHEHRPLLEPMQSQS
ncbi:hypothetical protein [Glycomyces arizonensis]|uniref:hypothetical protein n=1 Tax=Glycomyces arizonensis TaxID=256035 RepID=UPI0004209F75|nr:hypothetical protein [Glycomyces arizonensis]